MSVFEENDAEAAIARQFVERRGDAAARGIAHPANAGASGRYQRFDQRKHRARVGPKIGFEIEFAARQQNRDAVIADGTGEQDLVAGADRLRDRSQLPEAERPMPVVVMYMLIGFAVLDDFGVATDDANAGVFAQRRPWRALRLPGSRWANRLRGQT